MFALAQACFLALTNPSALGVRSAEIEDDFAGFTWHVRPRSPLFQHLINGTVELSTELLLLVVAWVFWTGAEATPSVVRLVLPLWGAVQLLVMLVAMAWDVGGRQRVVRLRVTHDAVWMGSRHIRLCEVSDIRAHAQGAGPLHRADLTIVHTQGTVTIAADGDDLASLVELAGRMTARVRATTRPPVAI